MTGFDTPGPKDANVRRTILEDIVTHSESFCCSYFLVRSLYEAQDPPHNWTPQMLADDVGVSTSTLRRWFWKLEDGVYSPCPKCREKWEQFNDEA